MFYITKIPKLGDVSADVQVLQYALKDKGYNPGPVDRIFGKMVQAAVKKAQKDAGLAGSGVIFTKTLAFLGIEIGHGDGANDVPKDFPSRDSVLAVIRGMCDGAVPTKNGPYKNIRETQGKNRSPQIDPLIKRQGGKLGDAYCLWGQQEILDELCAYYGLNRKDVPIPEGGGTQKEFSIIPKRFKVAAPVAVGWAFWRHKNGTGHVECSLSGPIEGTSVFKTFGFNTTAHGNDVVRDGQGAGYMSRETVKVGDMAPLGYVDIYAALQEAALKLI